MIAVAVTVFLLAVLWALVVFLGLPWGIAVVATVALALTWAALLAWRLFKARRAAAQIEKALHSQADAQAESARPDQREDIEAMRAEFQKALAALKGSKLGRGGRQALAQLPFYMIIGPPGSGKSTALRASGLKFPYLSTRGGVRGVGGTRNCEWWLTNEAVLLDTAGRYATEEEDHEEWMSFLDTLARARPRKPIQGLIVAVPVVDVGAESDEGAAELGRRMRERVDEVMARLKMVLPVYVLLTKADLIPGFVETFADLRKADRGQVWGFTLPRAEAAGPGEPFLEHLDELLSALEERCLQRLGEERQIEARERIYEFPQQLEAMRGQLAAFVEGLFAADVYRDTPILRGVYLTSGTQEGRVIDRVMSAMAEAFGVRPMVAEVPPVIEAKSYFLRDIFAKVMFPDRELAYRSAQGARRDELRRWALVGGAGLLAALLLVVSLRSFLLNRELLRSTGALTDAVAERLASTEGPPPLKDLEPLRARLVELLEGPRVSMRFGLYRGDDLLPHVRRLYAASVRRLLLDPIFRRDVDQMDAFARRLESTGTPPAASEYGRYYDRLKLHLLLTAPRGPREPRLAEAEQAWVARQVAERWASGWSTAADPAGPRLIEQNARLFARLLEEDASLALPRYEDLVGRERRVLSRLPLSTLAVERIAAEVEGKGYDLTLASMLAAPTVALRADRGVSGAFTRRAYEDVIRGRLENPADLVELWVLVGDPAEGETPVERELEQLRSRYFERYVEEWQRFLESVQVEHESIRALALLQDLTHGEPPPMERLIRAVGYNTRLAGTLARAGEGVVQKGVERVKKALGVDVSSVTDSVAGRGPRRLMGPADVEEAFAGFVDFGMAPERDPLPARGGGAATRILPIDQYQEQLASVREALQATADGRDAAELVGRVADARNRVQSLVHAQPGQWRFRLSGLLLPPIEAATSSLRDTATDEVARRWCAAVARPFEDLARRYPFAPSGDDASLADVADFFRPGTGRIWSFYSESLQESVKPAGDGFQFARQQGGYALRPELLAFLRRARGITRALFPSGASEPAAVFSVRVRPSPRIAAIILDVDGQRIDYRNTPEEWRRLTWPGPAGATGATLRVRSGDGQEETIQREGEWGLFRLLETASIRGAPEFTASFRMPALGAVVNIDFRPSRSESPFFGASRRGRSALLEPFREGPPVPLAIGRGGGGCN